MVRGSEVGIGKEKKRKASIQEMIKVYETFGRHCLIYETSNAAIGKCLLKRVLTAGGGAVQGGLVDFCVWSKKRLFSMCTV